MIWFDEKMRLVGTFQNIYFGAAYFIASRYVSTYVRAIQKHSKASPLTFFFLDITLATFLNFFTQLWQEKTHYAIMQQ